RPSTTATVRLLATARTTGRGAWRNCRQRISIHDRRGTVAGRCSDGGTRDTSAGLAEHRERRPSWQRLGRVARQLLDGGHRSVELVLRVEEPDAEAEPVRLGDGPGDDERPPAELLERCLRRPAGDRERDERPAT